MIDIVPMIGSLPHDMHVLAARASSEGYRFVDRLIGEWSDGSNRFERHGECLLAAYAGPQLVGIGGITVEPAIAGAFRMRRFYIDPAMRGRGIGRALAGELLDRARSITGLVTVHAGSPEAVAFWEFLGFQACSKDGYSHMLRFD